MNKMNSLLVLVVLLVSLSTTFGGEEGAETEYYEKPHHDDGYGDDYYYHGHEHKHEYDYGYRRYTCRDAKRDVKYLSFKVVKLAELISTLPYEIVNKLEKNGFKSVPKFPVNGSPYYG